MSRAGLGMVAAPIETNPEGMGFGGEERTVSGLELNFARQAAQQKKYGLPW
jgi:hypothetical protein